MRYRALLLLLFAIILGALAAYMVNTVVTQQVAQPVDDVIPQAGRPTVVAVTDLTPGLALEAIQLRIVDLPDGAYPETSFTTIDQALIDEPIVVTQMIAGEVVLPTKLSTGILLRGLTTRIPDGSRAISIPVNELRGVGGFVLPGDRVDILHTTTIGRRDGRPVTRTLMQNMIVLGVDQVSSEAAEEPVVVNVVTLLADPEQAKILTLAQQVGDMTLSLRNEGDRDDENSRTVALDDLWEFGPEDFIPRSTASALSSASSSTGSGAASSDDAVGRFVEIIRGLDISREPTGPGTATTTDDVN